MKLKAIGLFALLFLAIGYAMSVVSPSLPNLGNPTMNWLETGGITSVVLILLWEKWLRKESGETNRDG